MPHADRPAGPGRPTNERRDAATEREELEQMNEEAEGRADAPEGDPSRSVRQAERDAHVQGGSHADDAPGRR
jgi:hypothetical protein